MRRILLFFTMILSIAILCKEKIVYAYQNVTDPNTLNLYTSSDYDYIHAFEQGYITEDWMDRNLNEQVNSQEYKRLLADMISVLAPEKLEWFDSKISDYEIPLTRELGMLMSWYAAVCIGADFLNNNYDVYYSVSDEEYGEDDESIGRMMTLMPEVIMEKSPDVTPFGMDHVAAEVWNAYHSSPYSGFQTVAYDFDAGSFHYLAPFTVENAVCAIARLWASSHFARFVPIHSKEAEENTINISLIDKANETEIRSFDDLPRITGFVFQNGFGFGETTINHGGADIRRIAEWGFTSVRLNVTYETFFSSDCSEVNLSELEKLDDLIAEAIQYNIHLNLALMTIPGRTRFYDDVLFTAGGEFDLFVNPEKQKTAIELWQYLAVRYADIPGAYLSFTPFGEANNMNLSTGLESPDYGRDDVIACLDKIIEGIREKDPDRFIIYEINCQTDIDLLTEWNDPALNLINAKYNNVIMSHNYAAGPYVYAEMTDELGSDIDRMNHSMFKPEYPTYVYAAKKHVDGTEPITIDGCLPQGTQLDIYLESSGGGIFSISSETGMLYSELLYPAQYQTSFRRSIYSPYAVSDKKISITLDHDTNAIVISCSNGWIEWSGIDVILPQTYAVDRWYTYSGYDAYLDTGDGNNWYTKMQSTSTVTISPQESSSFGTHITVHDDLSYTSEYVLEEASLKSANDWADAVAALTSDCVVRFEAAGFSTGTTQSSMLRYYDDMLTAFDQYGIGWYSNDYNRALFGSGVHDPVLTVNNWFPLNEDLLKLLQSHR